MKYRKIANVRKLNDSQYVADFEIDFDGSGEYELVEGVIALGKSELINKIYQEITSDKFKGKIINYKDPTAKEIKEQLAIEIRSNRDKLLQQSDWTQLPDVPASTKDKWAEYRQALRDITTQAGFPENIDWPKKPA